MADLRLRPIRPDDEAFLVRLYASTRDEEMQLVDWSPEQKQAFLRMQFDAQHHHYTQHYPDARFDVIERSGVAFGRLYVDRRTDAIHVIDIALLPEYRCRGLGERFMRMLQREAAETGVPMTIHVEQFNPAMRLYQRLGFKASQGDGFYVLMQWRAGGHTIARTSASEVQS